jgi:uncharacterized Zn finger protein (UPF0148 family)
MKEKEIKYKELSQEEWDKQLILLAKTYLVIKECKKCGYPAVDVYGCLTCGDDNPDQSVEEERAEERKWEKERKI